ncbi:MAG: nickel-dependent lactate racemase [Thermoproteota archaeon]
MKLELRYGLDKVALELPNERVLFVAKPHNVQGVKNMDEEVRRSLANPIGSLPLGRLAKEGKKVAIVVDDITRLTPCRSILPAIIDELTGSGVSEKDIKIIIALGTHRPMTDKEIVDRYGEDVVSRIEVVNHNARDEDGLIDLGKTSLGTPVVVNREFYSADVKIAIGNVIPHLYAGWSGGAKAVQPGISSELTTYFTHIAAARIPFEEILGKAENPIRHEIEDVAKKVGLDFIVNTVLNDRAELVRAFAGDMIQAHREAVGLAERIFCPKIPSLADIVIASSYPADIDYWQAVKGAVAASLATKRGGAIVLLAPCYEGISPTHPEAERHGFHKLHEVEELVKNGTIRDLASAAFAMVQARIRDRAKLIIVSDYLDEQRCASLGAIKADSLQEALKVSQNMLGDRAIIGVLTSSELVPVIER